MNYRILVTGASGFIGRHLCLRLINAGCDVHAIVKHKNASLDRLGVKLWLGDLWNIELLGSALDGVNIVIHCAGDPSFGNGPQYQHANFELTSHVLDVVKKYSPGLARFVFVSTIGAVDRGVGDPCTSPIDENSPTMPTSDYGRSKLQAEDLVRRSGLPFAIIRPTMVVGNDMRFGSHFAVFARHALAKSLIGRIAWPGQLSVVHVDDLAEALWLVATQPTASGNTYFCAGEAVSIADYYERCAPQITRLPLDWFVTSFGPLLRWVPFSLKVMLLPALTARDNPLRALGWKPLYSGISALAGVIEREKARLDPQADPGGQSIITGAASGLGKVIVEYLAPRRSRLLLIDRDSLGLNRLAQQYPNCQILVVDLASERDLSSLLLSEEWNAATICELFACAGFGVRGRVQDIPIDMQKQMFAVNLLSRFTLAYAAIQSMSQWQFGRLVFISSSSAFQPLPFMASYAASNSALLSLGEAWSSEVVDQGIHLMTVCPGGMQTNFQRSAGVKELEGERLMTPEAVGNVIIHGLKLRHKTLIVSFRSFAMSMLARLLPRNVSLILWHRLMEKMR